MAVDAQGSVAEILSFPGQVKLDRRPETSRMTFERGIPLFRWGDKLIWQHSNLWRRKASNQRKSFPDNGLQKQILSFCSIFFRQIVLLPIAKEKMVFHFKNASR